ncbi:MAG: 6-phosphogluconolactonase [Candidatus Eremiobacteraeota bacterium]|nr:6-phosphogluconolactonase [Candidatus Eremiobacteraeota bacterium]
MKIEVYADAVAAAKAAAGFIATQARVVAQGNRLFSMAVSGGRSPWLMLAELARQDMPWKALRIAQVDERVAPLGDADRNLTNLRKSLQSAPLREEQLYPMPVDAADLPEAAAQYAATLSKIAGSPPVLDLVHLGLGPDGHTASLVPGDPVLEIADVDVAVTAPYQGRRRMTLTYPPLNRAKRVLWLVTGDEKAGMLVRLLKGDRSIPAGRVNHERAVVVADRAAAAQLTSGDAAPSAP